MTVNTHHLTKPNKIRQSHNRIMLQPSPLPGTVAGIEPPIPPKPQQAPPTNASLACHRAIHKIRLNALSHNYEQVESAANQQKCSVIVVVKADGYGHGAIRTALHLADDVGADAFAVATLEEGIALRKALQQTRPGNANAVPGASVMGKPPPGKPPPSTVRVNGTHSHVTTLFQNPNATTSSIPSLTATTVSSVSSVSSLSTFTPIAATAAVPPLQQRRRQRRAAHVRILVLGPPVGYPRCFDDYYYHGIECMVSGPEVAWAIKEWALNHKERKLNEIARTANETKEALANGGIPRPPPPPTPPVSGSVVIPNGGGKPPAVVAVGVGGKEIDLDVVSTRPQVPSATLGNVSGHDLAKEVRAILLSQRAAAENHAAESQQQQAQHPPPVVDASSVKIAMSAAQSTVGTISSNESSQFTPPTVATSGDMQSTMATTAAKTLVPSPPVNPPVAPTQAFTGIEEAAKYSRTRQKVLTAAGQMNSFCSDDDTSLKASDVFDVKKLINGIQMIGPDDEGGDMTPMNVSPSDSKNLSPESTPKQTNRGASPVSATSSTDLLQPNLASSASASSATSQLPKVPAPSRKRLRWHCLVDSGMGRLGFRTDDNNALILSSSVTADYAKRISEEQGRPLDIVVEILKDLVDMESVSDCPIEFYGMCTHMADAGNPNTTNYTQTQMEKFQDLVRRVRESGIPVPTVSTDNSAALLTTSLTHFDANALLKQTHFRFPSGPSTDTRGYVRTGGAIFGQRPTFRQLHPVSTLVASVRHVAILKKGESVGYDRAYIAPHDVRIATLTIGFADGYPRELGNGKGLVNIRGHLFKTAGNVCMDMLMVDLGPVTTTSDSASDGGDTPTGEWTREFPQVPDAGAQVLVGDDAILWGPSDEESKNDKCDGEGLIRLQDIAAKLGTTLSALTCGLDQDRVIREYK